MLLKKQPSEEEIQIYIKLILSTMPIANKYKLIRLKNLVCVDKDFGKH